MFSAIVKIYGNNVRNGRKTFEEVPSNISDKVREYILTLDPNFFDSDEEPVIEPIDEGNTHQDSTDSVSDSEE